MKPTLPFLAGARQFVTSAPQRLTYVWQNPPPHHDDHLLLKSWKRENPPGNPADSSDVAFRCGASAAFTPRNAPRPSASVREFTMATWNANELVANCDPKTLNRKAEVISRINADILALQEVGNFGVLKDFQARYLRGVFYPYQILVRGNDGINVALLSKFPIKKAYTYRDLAFQTNAGNPTRFERDLLEAVIEIAPAMPMKVFVTHLKSKFGGEKTRLQREAESGQIRKIISEHLRENPEELIALAGDLNDTPDSPAIRNLSGSSNLLRDPLKAEGKEYEATDHKQKYGRLDYLLASPALMKRYVVRSARVFHPNTQLEASDHDPVVMRFKVA